MIRPLSTDLRERLVSVVEREGISARAAAARFGVSVSSAIKWVRRYRETGSVAPDRIGSYKPNILSGPHGDWLVERIQADFTLRGLVAELAERGLKVDYVQVWRFVHARGLSFKKKRAARRTTPPKDRQAPRAVAEVSGTA
jgi:putative transposase